MKYNKLPEETKFVAKYNFYKLLNEKIDKLIHDFIDNNHIDSKTIFYEIDFDKKQVISLYVKNSNITTGVIQNKILTTVDNNLFRSIEKLYKNINNIIKTEDINNYFFDENGKIKQINNKDSIKISL